MVGTHSSPPERRRAVNALVLISAIVASAPALSAAFFRVGSLASSAFEVYRRLCALEWSGRRPVSGEGLSAEALTCRFMKVRRSRTATTAAQPWLDSNEILPIAIYEIDRVDEPAVLASAAPKKVGTLQPESPCKPLEGSPSPLRDKCLGLLDYRAPLRGAPES